MWILKPYKLFKIPLGCNFYVSAKLDYTLATHFIQGVILALFLGNWAVLYILGKESSDGETTEEFIGKAKQGFDLLDIISFSLGVTLISWLKA